MEYNYMLAGSECSNYIPLRLHVVVTLLLPVVTGEQALRPVPMAVGTNNITLAYFFFYCFKRGSLGPPPRKSKLLFIWIAMVEIQHKVWIFATTI